MRISRYPAALAALAVLFVDPAASAHVKPGQPAPNYILTTFDRHKISSDQLRGQVVVINLWATWCTPCKQEMPLLDGYYRAHARDGLRIFAVATEGSVPPSKLQTLASTLSFPLVRHVSSGAFPVIDGVPTSYVIDRAGIVRYAETNAFDAATLDKVVGPLLAEAAPAPLPAVPAANRHPS